MLENLHVAVFTHNPELYRKLEAMFQDMGIPVAQFSCSDRLEVLERWSNHSNLIAIFDGSQQPDACIRWITWLSEDRPNSISVWSDNELKQEHVAEAMRAGARDLLIGEVTAENIATLVKRLALSRLDGQPLSSVVAVSGGAGGSGASTLVANLAIEIAKREQASVGVLDLDPFFSGVGLLLNLRPERTLYDLQQTADMDAGWIKRLAATHPSGVSLIVSQGWPVEHLPIPDQLIRRAILLMQQHYRYVLVDLPRSGGAASRRVLGVTEAVVLVAPYSMSGAAGLRQTLFNLEGQGYPKHRILLVANAVSDPSGLSPDQWCRVMGREPVGKIPFDPASVNQAAAEGRSLAEVSARAPVTKSVQNLAHALCEFLRMRPVSARESPHFSRTSHPLEVPLATK